jgi:hypothetical protein
VSKYDDGLHFEENQKQELRTTAELSEEERERANDAVGNAAVFIIGAYR